MKINTTIEELVGDHPYEFIDYLKYCRTLSFTQDPDYGYLYKLFVGCLGRSNVAQAINSPR